MWALAWPAVALNSLQVINTLLDRGFIGHLRPAALTAHGAAINVMFLVFSLAMALSTSATALVSRAFGAEEISEYRKAARQGLSLAIIGGSVLAVLSALTASFAAHALVPSKDVDAAKLMAQFLSIYAIGLPPIYIIQVLAGSLRGVGDTKSPMVISGIQIAFHMLLNFLLVMPSITVGGVKFNLVGMGLPGAATALSVSAWIAALIYIGYAGKTPLGPLWQIQMPERSWVVRIFRIAVPSATMAVLRVASLTAFTLVLAATPTASVSIAAMGVAFGIESVMFMPAFGLSVSASALVGQSLGMKKPERAERLAWVAGHHGAYVTGVLAVLIFLLAPALASLMVAGKADISGEATLLIRYLASTEILFSYAMVMFGALQGAGDTVSPMWISIFTMWGLRVPLAYVLALSAGFGSLGAWWAISFTQAIQGVFALIAFRRGKWKTKKV